MKSNINVGDVVTVQSGFSDTVVEVGTVVAHITKNGRAVVVYSVSGEEKWAHIEAIVQVRSASYYANKS